MTIIPPKAITKNHTGESFLAIAQDYMGADGVYIFDEPEAALSPQRQLTLLINIHRCAQEGAQFIIVSHSPILLGIIQRFQNFIDRVQGGLSGV